MALEKIHMDLGENSSTLKLQFVPIAPRKITDETTDVSRAMRASNLARNRRGYDPP